MHRDIIPKEQATPSVGCWRTQTKLSSWFVDSRLHGIHLKTFNETPGILNNQRIVVNSKQKNLHASNEYDLLTALTSYWIPVICMQYC